MDQLHMNTIKIEDVILKTKPEFPWDSNWQQAESKPITTEICGCKCIGTSTEWTSTNGSFLHEVVTSDKDEYFSRVTIANTGEQPQYIKEILSLNVTDFNFANTNETSWRLFGDKTTRSPESIKFTEITDYVPFIHWDKKSKQIYKNTFSRDPFMVINNRKSNFLIGFVETDRQLADIMITRNGDTFSNLRAICHTNGSRLLPGKTMASQWLMLAVNENANTLIGRFLTLLKNGHGEFEPKAPPTVISSWHFYGLNVCQESVEKELVQIKQREIPADVYEIDGGWYDCMGDWEANPDKFPNGMKYIADKIREAGMLPGLWIGAFQASYDSRLVAEHPDWILRHKNGQPVTMRCSQSCVILDTSIPEVLDYIEMKFRHFVQDWGYWYIKLDFSNFIYTDPEAVPSNPDWNYLDLWREGVKAIKRGIGDDAFFLNCGGHQTAGMKYFDANKCGVDTYARWEGDGISTGDGLRDYMYHMWLGQLFPVCGTVLAFRLNDQAPERTPHGMLPLGNYTMTEATTVATAAFASGGLVQIGDPLQMLQQERLDLQSKVLPTVHQTSYNMDLFSSKDECVFLYKPIECTAGKWSVITAMNFTEKSVDAHFELCGEAFSHLPHADQYIVFDMIAKKIMGIYNAGETVYVGPIEKRTSRVIQVFPVPEELDKPFFVNCDIHFSGGKNEILSVTADKNNLNIKAFSKWRQNGRITAAIRRKTGIEFLQKDINFSLREQDIDISF